MGGRKAVRGGDQDRRRAKELVVRGRMLEERSRVMVMEFLTF